MGETSIEWTDVTWNPTRGCSRVSPGCEHCYAERQAARFARGEVLSDLDPFTDVRELLARAQPYHGLVRSGDQGPRWTGIVRLIPDKLAEPLRWTRPRRVFVNSMSDLFHESLSNEQIAAVFGVMAACPRHTFQVLTKRASRMREWFAWMVAHEDDHGPPPTFIAETCAENYGAEIDRLEPPWPLGNVHLGVSVEDQQRADERIHDLLSCPAAVRWVSYEPALGPVDFTRIACPLREADGDPETFDALRDGPPRAWGSDPSRRCSWVIIGGESGPGARPFDLAWARSTIAQCRAAGTAAFFKQAGSRPVSSDANDWIGRRLDIRPTGHGLEERNHLRLADRKGGDLEELPPDLRVRMFPGDRWPEARRG